NLPPETTPARGSCLDAEYIHSYTHSCDSRGTPIRATRTSSIEASISPLHPWSSRGPRWSARTRVASTESAASSQSGWRQILSSPYATRTEWAPRAWSTVESFQLVGVIAVNVKRTGRQSEVAEGARRGRADLRRLRGMREREIMKTSPEELADL